MCCVCTHARVAMVHSVISLLWLWFFSPSHLNRLSCWMLVCCECECMCECVSSPSSSAQIARTFSAKRVARDSGDDVVGAREFRQCTCVVCIAPHQRAPCAITQCTKQRPTADILRTTPPHPTYADSHVHAELGLLVYVRTCAHVCVCVWVGGCVSVQMSTASLVQLHTHRRARAHSETTMTTLLSPSPSVLCNQ